MDVARQPVELGDDQRCMAQPAGGERRGDLRPVVLLAAFDLLKLGDDDAAGAGDMAGNRLALRLQAQPRGALLRGRHPVVGNKARLARRAPRAQRGPARHFSAVSL